MTLSINRHGYPALLYFALIALILMSNFDAIFLDICKSPEMVFRLYLFEILKTQGTAFFFFLFFFLTIYLCCYYKIYLCCLLLYATTKTHKFNDLDEATVEKLKFRPIVDQTGTATYGTAKVIGEYLKLLAFNEYKINDCLKFPDIKASPSLQKNEEYVSYEADSLFTNIPLKETTDYIIYKIDNEKFLKPICKKMIFKRLLFKLTTGCTIEFNQRFYKQIDGCTMGDPSSVIFADIHMVRTENEVVKPMNLHAINDLLTPYTAKRISLNKMSYLNF